ncbi:MAG: hypothetical protein ACLSBC_03265 [[Clostridium] scindens]
MGTVFRCNDVLLEMTQFGKERHSPCQIYQKMGNALCRPKAYLQRF